MPRLRSCLSILVFLLVGTASPAASQSVAEIVDDMRARYEEQLETVDTYIVETNLYTSYSRKVENNGDASYETQTQMKGEAETSFKTGTTPSAVYGVEFERMKQYAAHGGTETVDGHECHVLVIDDPSQIEAELGAGAERVTYYVDAERHVPLRMVTISKTGPAGEDGPQRQTVTFNMRDYRTVDGLALPHRMEVQVDANLSEEQRQEMEKTLQQFENLPEAQRKQMEKFMGDQMDMIKRMLSGEGFVIEVESVQVNVEIPAGIFE